MFNFFKAPENTEEKNNKEEIIAAIHYTIKKNSDKPLIDIELNDYDDESIDALCSLLNILGNDLFYIDTINMIKDFLISENKEDVLIKIFTKTNSDIRTKILNAHKEKIKDEPCIRPSDMLR